MLLITFIQDMLFISVYQICKPCCWSLLYKFISMFQIYKAGVSHFKLVHQDGQTPVDYFSTYDPAVTSVLVVGLSEDLSDISSTCWCENHLIYWKDTSSFLFSWIASQFRINIIYFLVFVEWPNNVLGLISKRKVDVVIVWPWPLETLDNVEFHWHCNYKSDSFQTVQVVSPCLNPFMHISLTFA